MNTQICYCRIATNTENAHTGIIIIDWFVTAGPDLVVSSRRHFEQLLKCLPLRNYSNNDDDFATEYAIQGVQTQLLFLACLSFYIDVSCSCQDY